MKLKLTKAAGGSNGSMFAEDAEGRRWLRKDYGGNQDRVATELVANAVYREVGAAVAPAGTVDVGSGRKGIAYPTIAGEIRPHTFSQRGPSRRVGRHFMTDALLGNRDVAGLEDDNILWQPHPTREGVDRPVRLDQGGTLEFRAMGDRKEFGPVPEVVSLMAKPTRQGARSSRVTKADLKAQAAELGEKLPDARIDQLVDAAPWADSAMRERVRKALKARVEWMRRYSRGEVTVVIPGLQEGLREEREAFWLREAAAIPAKWNEALHPRDAFGKWINKAELLKPGGKLQLDSKTTLSKDKDGTFRVTRSGAITKGFTDPADAVRAAADKSAKSTDEDSIGGGTAHKDFNAYLSHRLKDDFHITDKNAAVKGVYTHPTGGVIQFGGVAQTQAMAEQELGNLRARLAVARKAEDKYVLKTVPTLESREKELAQKVKTAGWDDKIGSSFLAAAAPDHGHGFKPGDYFKSGTSEYKIDAVTADGVKLHNVSSGHAMTITHEGMAASVKNGTYVKLPDASDGSLVPSYVSQGEHLTWPSGPGSPAVKVSAVHPAAGTATVKVTASDAGGAGIGTFHAVPFAELKPWPAEPKAAAGSLTAEQAVKNVLEDFPPGTHITLKGATGTLEVVGPSADGQYVMTKVPGEGPAAPIGPEFFVSAKKIADAPGQSPPGTPFSKAKVGDTVHNPATSYEGKIIADFGVEWQLATSDGVKAYVPKDSDEIMKVGPHPGLPGPSGTGKPIKAKQANLTDDQGFKQPLKKLDIAVGDKIQMKKGGHIYTVTTLGATTGAVKAEGPNGTKNFGGLRRPAFITKADGSALKLKEPTTPKPATVLGSGKAGVTASYQNVNVGDVLKHGNGNEYVVSGFGTGGSVAYVKTWNGDSAGLTSFPVSAQVFGNANYTHTGKKAPGVVAPAAPEKTHAEHVASLKAVFAQLAPNETAIGKFGGGYAFQTPGGKLLYKDKDGVVKNVETGAVTTVSPDAVPPKAANIASAVAAAEGALKAKAAAPSAPAPAAEPDASWSSLPTGDAAESALVKAQGASGVKVGGKAYQAIDYYTGSGYGPMNGQLRATRQLGSVQTEEQIAAMDAAIEEFGGIPEDMVLWRGVNGQTGDAYQAAQVGQVIRDNGYISSSVSETFAHNWTYKSLVIKMRLPKGTKGVFVGHGSELPGAGSEREFILRHGVGFKVIAVRKEKGDKVLVVEPISGHL